MCLIVVVAAAAAVVVVVSNCCAKRNKSTTNLLIDGVGKSDGRVDKGAGGDEEGDKVDLSEPGVGRALGGGKKLHEEEAAVSAGDGDEHVGSKADPDVGLDVARAGRGDLDELQDSSSAEHDPLHNDAPVHAVLANLVVELHHVTKEAADDNGEGEVGKALKWQALARVLNVLGVAGEPHNVEDARDEAGEEHRGLAPGHDAEVVHKAVCKEAAKRKEDGSQNTGVEAKEVAIGQGRHRQARLAVALWGARVLDLMARLRNMGAGHERQHCHGNRAHDCSHSLEEGREDGVCVCVWGGEESEEGMNVCVW